MDAGLRTRIINLIKKSPEKSLSISVLHKTLKVRFPRLTKNQIKKELIEAYKVDAKRRRAGENPKYFIVPNKGGNAYRYTAGGETTKKGTGPFREIASVIDGDNKNITKIFGAPHLNSFDVHAGKSGRGKWGRPDVIVALYRQVGSSRPFNLHAIEYEKKGGFSPSNVAQARFAGSGADKCWLLFDSRDWPKNAKERRLNPSAERVRSFAEKIGVGLIYYRNLSRSYSWFMLLDAQKQKRIPEDVAALRHLFEGEMRVNKRVKKKEPSRRSRPKDW